MAGGVHRADGGHGRGRRPRLLDHGWTTPPGLSLSLSPLLQTSKLKTAGGVCVCVCVCVRERERDERATVEDVALVYLVMAGQDPKVS